jgi:hypothetical protein
MGRLFCETQRDERWLRLSTEIAAARGGGSEFRSIDGEGRRKRKRFSEGRTRVSISDFILTCFFFCYINLLFGPLFYYYTPYLLPKKKNWGPKILGALICSTVCTPSKPGLREPELTINLLKKTNMSNIIKVNGSICDVINTTEILPLIFFIKKFDQFSNAFYS